MTLRDRLGFSKRKQRHIEVIDDALAVRTLMERLRNAREAEQPRDRDALHALEIAREMLARVDEATTLEEKWSCINKANATLIHACKTRDEQAACMLRLKNLFPLLARFKDRLPDPFRSFDPKTAEVREFNRRRAYEVLATAAQGWHLVNEQNAFSTRFWNRALVIVALLLLAAVVGMETNTALEAAAAAAATAEDAAAAPAPAGSTFRYVWSVVFGGLGGAISMLLNSRGTLVSATSFRVAISQACVRMLLGGVGAFVVYLAIESELVFNADLAQQIEGFGAFAIVAIAAGFSERLFITTLERIAGTVESSRPAATGTDGSTRPGAGSVAGAEDDHNTLAEMARLGDREDLLTQRFPGAKDIARQMRDGDEEDAAHQVETEFVKLAAMAADADEEDSDDQSGT